MRRLFPLCALAAALAFAPGVARADDMDGWCAQVKKASSIIICSDPELRQQAIARNKLFDAARAKLSPEAYKVLTEDQQRWIKSYTARCGVSIDDPPPTLPIPQSVIECYRRESGERTAYLPNLISRWIGNDMLHDAGGPPWAEIEALDAWDTCTETAADKFADQPEPARTVAEAAMATCEAEETKYLLETVKGLAFPGEAEFALAHPETLEQGRMPQLLARVMAVRAARAKLRQESPETKPAIDYGRM